MAFKVVVLPAPFQLAGADLDRKAAHGLHLAVAADKLLDLQHAL
jgi:hypothetical protein